MRSPCTWNNLPFVDKGPFSSSKWNDNVTNKTAFPSGSLHMVTLKKYCYLRKVRLVISCAAHACAWLRTSFARPVRFLTVGRSKDRPGALAQLRIDFLHLNEMITRQIRLKNSFVSSTIYPNYIIFGICSIGSFVKMIINFWLPKLLVAFIYIYIYIYS